MTPSPVVLFIVNIMIPLTLHFIIFTGFRVEAVVRKPTAGLSVLKQALVPILMGPLPQQVTINQTLMPRDYLRIVFTTWQFEVEMHIVGRDERCPTKKMKEALAAMYNSLGLYSGRWGWLLQHKSTRQRFLTMHKLPLFILMSTIYI